MRGLLFDRLAGEEPALATTGRPALAGSIARELERLFNTRTPTELAALARRPAAVIDYGIPDLSLFPPADAEARTRLADELVRAIRLWEPRLLEPQVTVERAAGRADGLVARIVGRLRQGAEGEPVSFVLALDDSPAGHAG
jgi:type VI secretion system protein ImpF